MPLRVIQHYSDWICTAVMSNDVMKDNVITHNRGTNPVTIMLNIVFARFQVGFKPNKGRTFDTKAVG